MSRITSEDITLNHLKILKTVDDSGSFSKAAYQLGYSQSLISKKVKQLEDYFGVLLVNRSPGSIKLTNQGRKLISQTFQVIETVETLQREFQQTLSADGEDLILGATPLILEVWLKHYWRRFQLCFPSRNIQEISLSAQGLLAESSPKNFDILLNSFSAYKDKHHCTRLTTHRFQLISFGKNDLFPSKKSIKISDINPTDLLLLDEIYQELCKNQVVLNYLRGVRIIESYQELLDSVQKSHKSTILPDFCQFNSLLNYPTSIIPIQDVNEYGVYLHVPHFSELLILGESLVRSFRIDQDDLAISPQPNLIFASDTLATKNILRVGIQRDSIGQFIASYGVKYVFDLQRESNEQPIFQKNIEIDRNFTLQIVEFACGEQMNQQMKRGDLDICILDDTSLLNNGTMFFNNLSFGSKLIGIASYNIFGEDMRILLPKDSPIATVPELRGKRISTLFGSNAHRFIITLFNLYGLEISRDCHLVNEDPHTASMSFRKKQIDAHVCCDTFTSIFQEYVSAKKLPLEQNFGLRIPSLRGIVCRSRFLKENPKLVIAYLHDLVIANHWFHSDSARAIKLLNDVTVVCPDRVFQFFAPASGNHTDPTLKPQWSWLLKTLNRRLDGQYGISLFDVDFWMDDYFLRLVYNLLELDYHFHQVSFSSQLSNGYFPEEKFNRYAQVL